MAIKAQIYQMLWFNTAVFMKNILALHRNLF
jgi:hypothetical protein